MDNILTSEDPWWPTKDSVLTKFKIKEAPDVGHITYPSQLYPILNRVNKEAILALLLEALSNIDADRQKGKVLVQKIISRAGRNPDLFVLKAPIYNLRMTIVLIQITLETLTYQKVGP